MAFYDSGICFNYKMVAALPIQIVVICSFYGTVQKVQIFPRKRSATFLSRIVVAGGLSVELKICTITSHYVIIKGKIRERGKHETQHK